MNARTQRLSVCAALTLASCADSDDGGNEPSEVELAWSEYDIPQPDGAVASMLRDSPFLPPEKVCVPADSIENLPEGASLETAEDGTQQLCVWNLFSGNVPEGMRFNDVLSCDNPFTQGPPWFAKPERVHESPEELLEDEAFVAELDWVQAQIESSGCGCCHASGLSSGNTTGFDVSAPGVWTDTMTNAQLAISTGEFEEHLLFGYVDPQDNQGFDRRETMFASTDPARMKAFFQSEFDRRGGTEEDTAEAVSQFEALFGAVKKDPTPCVEQFEGITDGRIIWNGDEVRQLMILEEGSATPSFPPNLDRPEGTVWALYVDPDGEPIASDTVAVGDIPEGTQQMVPADGSAPQLVDGQTYRLFGSSDIMVRRQVNCTFTYSAQ